MLRSVVPLTQADQDVDIFAAARRLHTPTWLYDIDAGRILHANAPACELWQAASEAELRARDLSRDMSPMVAKRLAQYKADFIESDATFHEMWTLYPNNVPTSVMVLFSGFRLPDGRMVMQCEVAGAPEDQPDNLRSAEALLHTDVMIVLYTLDGHPLYKNPAARNMTRAPQAPMAKMFCNSADMKAMMSELNASGEHRQVALIKTRIGQRWFDLSAKRCQDSVTSDPAILITAIDVTELKTARDKARYLASRDQLTGCYNRSHLQNHMAKLAASDMGQAALLYFDVDRFKQINDSFGHEIGDAVLVDLAKRATALITEDDSVVRLGGDEFVIILGGIRDDTLRLRVAEIFGALSAPSQCGAVHVNTKVSIGVATFDPACGDVDAVLREADIALYQAKKGGRNRVVYYAEDMGIAAEARAQLEAEVDIALKTQAFALHYQPRLDVATNQITSVEGLVRWRHPTHGRVAPDVFIPLCEETGQIHALGRQVLEMGFAQAMAWDKAGVDTQLSLNISPRQFSDIQFVETLASYTRMPHFPTEKIELELTETALIGDQDDIAAKLVAITEMGYRIAIDDFGTGYSNLSYISRFPLHCLKIDQSFIRQLPQSGPVVRLILALAQQIGVTSVAEGVETRAQFDWLKHHGCNQIQGFFLAHPAPAQEIEAMLGQERE